MTGSGGRAGDAAGITARRVTATHVYAFLHCARQAALDLTLPRSERRPPHPWEEFSRARGRDFEAAHVAALGVVAPAYPERDWARGAAATLELMRAGVPWIHQGVLLGEDRLGLPDLLHRTDGPSDLGAHHYEVLDVKSSGQPRGDQVLQVTFYSRLLALTQGRMPARAAIVLKDGREEWFDVADYAAACADAERDLLALRTAPELARPFWTLACEGCHWNHRCVPEMAARDDLSLVHGMTPGARDVLEALSVRTAADLATFEPHGERERGRLDATLLRRLRRAAQARVLGRPIPERQPRSKGLHPGALVHLLRDPYAESVLWLGVQGDLTDPAGVRDAFPDGPDDEWRCLQELVGSLSKDVHLLHFGPDLPRLHEAHAHQREDGCGLEARFVDVGRRLRHAALYPGPVPLLADLVRHGLSRDPHRLGHQSAAAMWPGEPDGRQRLRRKGRADLADLAELVRTFLPDDREAAQPTGSEEAECS